MRTTEETTRDQTLSEIVYVSTYTTSRVDNELAALRAILSSSRRNNSAAEVTGYLIFDGETFLQILEGTPERIDATLDRIGKDERHRDIEVLRRGPITRRSFGDWAMAGYLRNPDQRAIFARHGIGSRMNRAELDADMVRALAQELSTARPAA